MNRLFYFLLIIFSLQACEEVPPEIPELNLTSERKVIVEEFSGAQCVPCAAAKADLDNLQALYGENLIVVTMHTYAFPGTGDPVPGSRYDFRTDQGQQVLEYLGRPLGIPAAVINRRQFDGIDGLQLLRSQWAGFVAEEIDRPPKVALNLETEYDDATRELTSHITIVPGENIDGDVRLLLLINESNLIDKQKTDTGTVDEFQHDHILRAFISAVDGDPLGALTNGTPVEKTYTFTLPEEDGWWIPNNCNVVAYVEVAGADQREVLQAEEVHLGE